MPDPNNLTFINERITFMCICKCANTSLKLAVCKAWGLHAKFPGLNHFIAQLVDSHGAVWATHKHWIKAQKDHFAVTIVRHPQARIASFIRDKVKSHHGVAVRMNLNKDMSQHEIVWRICNTNDETCDQHIRSLTHELVLDGEIIPNYIARVESLDLDWIFLSEYVRDWCKRDLGKLPKCNTTEGTVTFTTKQMEMITERYRDDFKYFDYQPALGPF